MNITNIILTEIKIIVICYGVRTTQLTTNESLCSCNNNTLKMAAVAAEICW